MIMVVPLILLGLLLIAWHLWLKKTSTFGSFLFIVFLAFFTLGLVQLVFGIGYGLFLFWPALVCGYMRFRHDRTKLKKFYDSKHRKP